MVATVDSTPWLTEARKLVGLREIIGSKHEAKILQFFAEAGHPNVRDDETSWCAAFANAMLVRSGYAGTGSLLARSFLTWGTALDKPVPGCIVVFRRGKEPWMGHVGFYVAEGTTGFVRVLGGNQGNAVSTIPMPKADVLGYRWPLIKAVAPVAKSSPKKEATKVGTGAAGGAVVVGTGAAAVDAGWSWLEIAMAVGGVVLVAVAAWFVWRWWMGRPQKAEVGHRPEPLGDSDNLANSAELNTAPPPTGDPVGWRRGRASQARIDEAIGTLATLDDEELSEGLRKAIDQTRAEIKKAMDKIPPIKMRARKPPAAATKPAAKPKPAKPAAKKRRA